MNPTTDKKIITLRDAGQRLQWRFTQGKPFQPNQNDADALNMLLKTINQTQTQTVQENRLFAKLYIATMIDFSIHFQNAEFAHKQISKILQTDINTLCQDLTMKLNDMEINHYLQSLGLLKTSDKEVREQAKSMNGEMFLSVSDTWDLDSVTALINTSVTQSINNFKNLP